MFRFLPGDGVMLSCSATADFHLIALIYCWERGRYSRWPVGRFVTLRADDNRNGASERESKDRVRKEKDSSVWRQGDVFLVFARTDGTFWKMGFFASWWGNIYWDIILGTGRLSLAVSRGRTINVIWRATKRKISTFEAIWSEGKQRN